MFFCQNIFDLLAFNVRENYNCTMKKNSLLKYMKSSDKYTCTDCCKKIADYIESRLDLREEHLLVLHVQNCKECMDELEANYMFASAFKFLEDGEDDSGITKNIREVLAKSEEEYTIYRRQKITFITEIITTVILLALIAVFLLSDSIRGVLLTWGR